jgi:DNA invertase Pin-like site-specific DNA recombinase
MKNKTVVIYARVSTGQQKVDLQLRELRRFVKRSGWKLFKEYIDEGYSGKDTKRPAYSQMMEAARRRRFNILLVWKFDRLSRSTRDLLNTLEELDPLGVDFISYENQIDTTTPSGKLFFTIVAAIAQFEREIIRERVIAGLENARSKGKVLGRPRLGDSLIDKAKELRKQGMSYRQIGRELETPESTVRKRLKSVK